MKFKRASKPLGTDATTAEVAAAPARKQESANKPSSSKKASGKKSFTLLIGDEGAILIFMQGATVLRRLFALSPQPDHTGTFAELMKSNPGVPLSILVDVLDQQYVRHSFPPVSPMSIGGLVARRLEREFNPEDMKAGLQLGRNTDGRKEWNYLIISLTSTPLMQQWLDFVLELPNEMKGIFLLPVEMQQIIPALSKTTSNTKPHAWQFLITNNKVSGFRQVILHHGKLVFTRVTQAVEDAIPAVIAGNLEQEILNTLEYVRRLDFKENDDLEIFVITAQEVVESLDLQRFGAGVALAFSPLEVASAMGFHQAALSADRFGDVVISAAFATARKRSLRFANAYINKLTTFYKARRGVTTASALITLGLLVMSGLSLADMLGIQSSVRESELKQNGLKTQIANAQKAIDTLSSDIAFKSLAVATYDTQIKNAASPMEFITTLAPLLPAEMRVKRLQWGPPGAFLAGGAAVPAAPASTTNTPAASESTRSMLVEIEYSGTASSAEQLTKEAENFIQSLKTKLPLYTITAQPFPWIGEKKATQEISFDQQNDATPLIEGKKIFQLTFSGPNAAKDGAGVAETNPPAKPEA